MRRRRPGEWDDVGRVEQVRRSRAELLAEVRAAPDEGDLPSREPVRRLRAVPAERDVGFVTAAQAAVFADALDGVLTYPSPERKLRPGVRARRLYDRLTPAMAVFVLLAVAAVAASARQPGIGLLVRLDEVLRLAFIAGAALLPAAIVIWRPDAWRSAPLVLLGAVVWTTLPVAGGLLLVAARRLPASQGQLTDGVAILVSTLVIAACLGPALMAIGLDRSRKRRTLLPGLRTIALVIAIAAVNANRIPPLATTGLPSADPLTAAARLFALPTFVAGFALPIEAACLLMLWRACLEGLLDGEARTRFWQCATAGASLVMAASVWQLSIDPLTGVAAVPAIAAGVPAAVPAIVMVAMGTAFILAAFGSPVWSGARDAAWRRSPPEEVFAWGDASGISAETVPLRRIVAIAAGADHALALDDSGHVGAWGNDYVHQTDVPARLDGVTAIAAGEGFSMALKSDGTVVAWGANDRGQCTVPRGLCDVVAIAAGESFGLALTTDGRMVAWGDGAPVPVPGSLSAATAIAAGRRHCLALLANGSVVAWGDGSSGQTDVPDGIRDAVAVSAGSDFSMALRDDGTIVAWGDNTFGQLDVPSHLPRVTSIAAGAFHAVALTTDGSVVAWGGGGQRVGEAHHPWRLIDFRAVAAGDGFSLAVRAA